jgi:hypothetical protein
MDHVATMLQRSQTSGHVWPMADGAAFSPFNARNKPAPIGTVRPYRPVVFNKQSHTRFERNRTGELIRHLRRHPSFPELLLIGRIVSVEWWLLRTDARIDAGIELSGHDIRGRLAAENRLRLDLVALGLQAPTAGNPLTATEYGRLIDARRGAA